MARTPPLPAPEKCTHRHCTAGRPPLPAAFRERRRRDSEIGECPRSVPPRRRTRSPRRRRLHRSLRRNQSTGQCRQGLSPLLLYERSPLGRRSLLPHHSASSRTSRPPLPGRAPRCKLQLASQYSALNSSFSLKFVGIGYHLGYLPVIFITSNFSHMINVLLLSLSEPPLVNQSLLFFSVVLRCFAIAPTRR